jgi:Flp pilus assembly pilin Flp
MTKFHAFLKDEDGLVTIEWIGIAAVMILAGVAIAGFIMEGADTAGGNIANGVEAVGAGANAPALPTFDGN